MADLGHQLTDKELEKLEKKIAREYAIAAKDMRRKLRDYMEQFEEGRAVQKALLDAGKITKKEYRDWVYRHTMMGQQWRDMKNVLAEDLQKASDISLRIARGQMADIYALNANYATYQIEHDFNLDTAFTLYNHDTAEYLLEQQRQLMPGPSAKKAKEIAANKALQWDKQKIQSAVLQGVLQGESPYDVAKRLTGVAQMEYNASVRYARTMTTSAQNAGRYNSYRRAKGLGVDLKIEWQATLDGRTRHEHRMMHGQRKDVDEPFVVEGIEILYPAQSDGPGSSDIPQSMIWNCRCTLLAWVKGFEGDTVKSSPKMGGMSFDEWQKAKEPKPKKQQKSWLENFANMSTDGFAESLGGMIDYRWRSETDDDPSGIIRQKIDATLSKLKQDYPLQGTKSLEYKSTTDRITVCDYDRAYLFLPDGLDDRRLDDDFGVMAQVFPNFNKETKIDSAVVAFNRGMLSTDPNALADAIADREKILNRGNQVFNLSGFSPEATTVHEWGHMYAEHMTTAMINSDPIADEYFTWYKSLSKEEKRSGVSWYAAENRSEFEAECFLEMQMPNPRPIAVKWWAYMQAVVKAGY